MISANMARRVGVAAVAIPLAFLAIYLGGWVLSLLIAALGILGTLEFGNLARARDRGFLPVPAAIAAALLPLSVYLLVSDLLAAKWLFAAFAFWLMALAVVAISRGPDRRPLEAVAITNFAPLYASGLPAAIIVLRHTPDTPGPLAATWLVLLPLALTWACDSLAMTFGGWIGGPRFAPVTSPNKTWSGSIAGALGAVVLAPVFDLLFLDRFGITLSLPLLLAVGAVVGTLGQMGDLAESLFKREAGIKDSGTFFPGHGGVLDRLDSLYWVLPSTALVFNLFGVI